MVAQIVMGPGGHAKKELWHYTLGKRGFQRF